MMIMRKYIKYLIENTINFNSADYSNEETDLIDTQTISNLTYKYFPKDKEELWEILIEKLKENIEYPHLNDIDTSEITDMSDLFSVNMYDYFENNIDIERIKIIDLSAWNTSNVNDMSGMFCGCSSLIELNLSTWDTSNVVNMNHMFEGCTLLKKLDISKWDTSNVTNTVQMFYDCNSLDNLDLSNWDISNLHNVFCMFDWCKDSIVPDWYFRLKS